MCNNVMKAKFTPSVVERAWSPHVVLVINDNPYGLIVALSYICRIVHRQCLSHMLASRL
jgi:hypothetical protein